MPVPSATNAKKLLYSTDYPLDKVVYMYETSFSVPGFGFNDVTINHGLGFAPLIQGIYTLDAGWPTVYDENSGPVNSSGNYLMQTFVETDSTTITLYNSNAQASAKTIYWRLYGFMPSDVNVDASFTNTGVDDFMFSTDYNYAKLFMSGVTASSSDPTETIVHGLGYRPQVLTWVEGGGSIGWMNSWVQEGGTTTCRVTDTSLIFTRSGSTNKFHYRIYLDD